MRYHTPYGYFDSDGYKGRMPDGHWETFGGDQEYHRDFWAALGYKP